MNYESTNGARQKTGKWLIYISSFALFLSAAMKFAHVEPVATQLAALGFAGTKLASIALLEVGCSLLYLIPASRPAGVFLITAYMGGAIAAHVSRGNFAIQPVLILMLIWLGIYLRHPEILARLDQESHSSLRSMKLQETEM